MNSGAHHTGGGLRTQAADVGMSDVEPLIFRCLLLACFACFAGRQQRVRRPSPKLQFPQGFRTLCAAQSSHGVSTTNEPSNITFAQTEAKAQSQTSAVADS